MELETIKEKFADEILANKNCGNKYLRRYSRKFKKAVIECLNSQTPVSTLAQEFDVTTTTISAWKRRLENKTVKSNFFVPVVTTDQGRVTASEKKSTSASHRH